MNWCNKMLLSQYKQYYSPYKSVQQSTATKKIPNLSGVKTVHLNQIVYYTLLNKTIPLKKNLFG